MVAGPGEPNREGLKQIEYLLLETKIIWIDPVHIPLYFLTTSSDKYNKCFEDFRVIVNLKT